MNEDMKTDTYVEGYYVEPVVLVPGLKDKLRLVVQAKTPNGFKRTKPCTYIMKSW